jgi:hypothetical protein
MSHFTSNTYTLKRETLTSSNIVSIYSQSVAPLAWAHKKDIFQHLY